MKKTTEKTNKKRVFGAKWLTVAISAVLIVAVGVGVTAALLMWRSEKSTSVFGPAASACEVIEKNGSFTVKNSGDTGAYIRAMFTVTWKNSDGEIYGKLQPEADTDYEIELDLDGWFLGDDGFYYCKQPVKAGESTKPLIKSFRALDPERLASTDGETVFPDDYTLTVDMAASAIQSEPAEAAEQYWNVKADGDGYLGK